MFSNFPGPFRKIVTAISACKSGRIDRGYGDSVVVGVKQVQSFSKGEPKVQGFYPAEKFLKRCEVGYYRKIKDLLNSLHITNILNKFSIMLVSIILEKNKDEKLMLVVDLLRIFTGIQIEMS